MENVSGSEKMKIVRQLIKNGDNQIEKSELGFLLNDSERLEGKLLKELVMVLIGAYEKAFDNSLDFSFDEFKHRLTNDEYSEEEIILILTELGFIGDKDG